MWSATFEAANVRHEHEWRVWQNSKIPEQKILMPASKSASSARPGRARYERRPLGHFGRRSSDDLVRPAAGRWKIAGFRGTEEPAARMKSSALDSACIALSPNGTLKLSLIFGRESPLHLGPH